MGYRTLYFCEFTLKFFRTEKGLLRHMERNSERHPPGDEIYRKDNISMFEVDGSKNKMYCQVLRVHDLSRPLRTYNCIDTCSHVLLVMLDRICASWRSCSWTTRCAHWLSKARRRLQGSSLLMPTLPATRRCTTTSTPSCSTLCVRWTTLAATSWVTFQR